ncbi:MULTISPECIES: hypothetical protein [Pseudomonas]|nr:MULTISPECIES: hypothetical protein [Pseudomonas]MBI3907634.1 hypothetical protein [Pseudomonas fluorescens]
MKVFDQQMVARNGMDIGGVASLGRLHSLLAWLFVILVVGHFGAATISNR